MGQDDQISAEQLKQVVSADMDKLVGEVVSAVNAAPGGAVIGGSEEAVREAMGRFRQLVYQKAVQLRADAAAKAAFSPCGQRPQRPPST